MNAPTAASGTTAGVGPDPAAARRRAGLDAAAGPAPDATPLGTDPERPPAAPTEPSHPATAAPPAPPGAENGRKRTVEGVLVKVLLHARDDRGMSLEPYASRCVRAGELHELVMTDQCAAALGDRIDRVGFLGFAEITRAGVIDRGDVVRIAGEPVGAVLGFDACHFPNHYNILIAAPARRTGRTLGLSPESAVSFGPAEPAPREVRRADAVRPSPGNAAGEGCC